MGDFRQILSDANQAGRGYNAIKALGAYPIPSAPEDVAKYEAECVEREERRRQSEVATVAAVIALRHFSSVVCQPDFDLKDADSQWERSCAVAEAIRVKAQSLCLPSYELTNMLARNN